VFADVGESFLHDAHELQFLRIDQTSEPQGDAKKTWQELEKDFRDQVENYQRIRIDEVDYRGWEAADWEFTYRSGGAELHALSRVFVVDGRGYSLFFQTRSSDDWEQAREDFDRIAASFRPA